MSIYDRSISLIGENYFNGIQNKTIAIIGLGGVGGTALEALARSGFCSFLIVDKDIVDETNLNRQILYTYKDIGQIKTECAKKHIISIIPNIKIDTLNAEINDDTIHFLDNFNFDFLIDAIDSVNSKILLYKYCKKRSIPFISCLGMGNKINPEDVLITTLDKTSGDPLAKKIRSEVRKENINLREINVVFSKEESIVNMPKPSSMIMVPSTAGLIISKYVINFYR